ncbi:MAG TPA: hypothetical protein VMM14_06200 [Acidimicrobiia bacterium]|nr:hypothetical protein [Acidimicrobiia bacterium]
MTNEPDAIEELFIDPTGTMAAGEPLAPEKTYQTREFLESVFAEKEKWP